MKHWIGLGSIGIVSLNIKFRALVTILFTVVLASCNEPNEKSIEEEHPLNVIHENDSLSNEYKTSSDLLIQNNSELSIVIQLQLLDLGDGVDSSGSDNLKKLNEIDLWSDLIVEEIDRQYGYLSDEQMPFESNFDELNRFIKEFNQFINKEFSIDESKKTQVLLRPFDYENFLLSPKKYLIQMRIKVSNTAYYLMVELLKEALGIRKLENAS